MLVPESYQLFVCPFACGRHGAIGAIKQGLKDRLSYLYIDETDIVSGSYEALIVEAVDELFDALDQLPKVLMIFVSCLDDLLGTDHEAFLNPLREKYREIRFTVCHMNPITLGKDVPPPVNIQRKIYGLLEKRNESKTNEVAFYGNNIPTDIKSEIYEVLQDLGYESTRHISEFDSFEKFQELSRVKLNIVMAPIGLMAAKDVLERLEIDYIYAPISYNLDEIERNYQKIFSATNNKINLKNYRDRAEKALIEAKNSIGSTPILIDTSATIRPFSLARLLIQFGFNVEAIYVHDCIPIEKESCQWLSENARKIKVISPEQPRSPYMRQQQGNCIAIGYESAYLTGTTHIVNLVNDEMIYGFQGIEKLMKMIVDASNTSVDLKEMINEYGIVV